MNANSPTTRGEPADNRSTRFWQARQGWLADLAGGIPGLVKFLAGITVTGTTTITGNETVSGTLGVTGATTLNGATTFNAATNLDPWYVDLIGIGVASSNTNWATVTVDATSVLNSFRLSTGAQNAAVAYPVVLSAGSWTLTLVHSLGNNRGIYTIDYSGNSIGTIDGYNAATTPNTYSSLTFTVATTGKYLLNLKMATKNGASANYYGAVTMINLWRTA